MIPNLDIGFPVAFCRLQIPTGHLTIQAYALSFLSNIYPRLQYSTQGVEENLPARNEEV